MGRVDSIILASALSLAAILPALAQVPQPAPPAGAPATGTISAAQGTPNGAATLNTPAARGIQTLVKPSPTAAETPETPVLPGSSPDESPTNPELSPANEPSELPPSDGSFVPETDVDAVAPFDPLLNGPGSINHPLISGPREEPAVAVAQPVPVKELSFFFGAVLLLAAIYLTYTARLPDDEGRRRSGPSGRP